MSSTAPTPDYYALLEISPNALHDEIKASYRRLALRYHPDKNRGWPDATAKTQLINEAWGILGDKGKRAKYDSTRPKPSPTPTVRSGVAATARSSRPGPPPMQPKAREEAYKKAQASGDTERAEWLEFEKRQTELVRQCREEIKTLEKEIEELREEMRGIESRLEHHGRFRWRMSEVEWMSEALRGHRFDCSVELTHKSFLLGEKRARLKTLEDEFSQRRYDEGARLAAKGKQGQ